MDTDICKHAGDETGTPEQGNPAVSPYKMRTHKAHDDENMDEPLSHYVISGHDIGYGHAYHQGGQCSYNGHEQASSESRVVVLLSKEPDIVLQGKASCIF